MRYLPLAQLKREGETMLYDQWAFKEVSLGYQITRVAINENLYAARTLPLAMPAPHIWIPMAVAGAIIANPTVTRRFWTGWMNKAGGVIRITSPYFVAGVVLDDHDQVARCPDPEIHAWVVIPERPVLLRP